MPAHGSSVGRDRRPTGARIAIAVVVLAVALGLVVSLVLEALQSTTLLGLRSCPWRQGDLDDVAMNTVGAALGWLVGALLLRVIAGLTAPGRGVEPLFTDSKSAVLPLDDPGPAERRREQ